MHPLSGNGASGPPSANKSRLFHGSGRSKGHSVSHDRPIGYEFRLIDNAPQLPEHPLLPVRRCIA
jgi:hypothetical protein